MKKLLLALFVLSMFNLNAYAGEGDDVVEKLTVPCPAMDNASRTMALAKASEPKDTEFVAKPANSSSEKQTVKIK